VYGAHDDVAAEVEHTPLPLQSFPVTLLPEHWVGPHDTVVLAYCRHWPEPSHWPSARHEAGKFASGAHSSSGSLSAATLPQVPSVPLPFLAAEHARQAPPQASLQQKPSTQKPLAQAVFPPQAWPLVSRHWPELQI
jgi:hypothetical protein